MYGLISELKAVSGQREALLNLLLRGSGDMPGCRTYVVAVDTRNDSSIWITEVWDDEASHDASLQLASVRQTIEQAGPLIAGFGERIITQPVGGAGLR